MRMGLIALLVAGPVVLPGFAGARETSSDAGRYRIVWKEVPAGRGERHWLPFYMLKEEHRTGAVHVQPARERLEYRDVPAGRGETQSLPFLVR